MTTADRADRWTADLAVEAERYDAVSGGPPWMRARRAAGRNAFIADGLPMSQDEAWSYTRLDPLLEHTFAPTQPAVRDPAAAVSGNGAHAESTRIVLVDGRLQTPSHVTGSCSWSALPAESEPPVVTEYRRHAFTALHDAVSGDGVWIRVTGEYDGPIVIEHHRSASGKVAALTACAVRIQLSPGATASVIETWADCPPDFVTLEVPSTEIVVAADATLRYYRLAGQGPAAFHVASIRASVATRGRLEAVMMAGSRALDRVETTVAVTGADAAVSLGGAAILAGDAHSDLHTVIQHRAPECVSDQLFKTVLLDRAHNSFQGTIEVDSVAQGTDAFQLSKTLMLDDTCRSDARPQLRISADQVRCTHGATVGPLAPDQQHYLQSRGIPPRQTIAMLVHGFLGEVIRRVDDPDAAVQLQARMSAGLAVLEAA